MPEQRVRELADSLAHELESEELNAEARESLATLRDEIDAALSESETVEAPPSARARSLVERFESEHPELTALVQRLADALSSIGL